IGSQFVAHTLDGGFIGEHETAAESVDQHLAAQIVDKIILAMRTDVSAQAIESRSFAAVRKCGTGVHWPPGEIPGPALAHGPVAFERQAERIEPRMAGGAAWVFAMPGQHLA